MMNTFISTLFLLFQTLCVSVDLIMFGCLNGSTQSVPQLHRLLWSVDHVHPVLHLRASGVHEVQALTPAVGLEASDGVTAIFLINHKLLEGVEIGRDEGADRLIVIVEQLLPSAL